MTAPPPNPSPIAPTTALRVASFYRFLPLPHCRDLRQPLLEFCQAQEIKGTILLAPEGINGTVAGTPDSLDRLLADLCQRLDTDLDAKTAPCDAPPFRRMKVKLKREIITLGQSVADPNQAGGIQVDPVEWNRLLADPDVVVIDTRNDYEVAIGSFENAKNPQTRSFREFPDYVAQNLDPQRHKKVAMFCTGGIRCEKASAYLRHQGFDQVYQLQGGILKYLETIPPEHSRWHGDCFVFDQRVAVTHGLQPGDHDLCLACGHPISAADQATAAYEPGISCPYCIDQLTPARRARQQTRQQQRQNR
jgi:UPF0176 protein